MLTAFGWIALGLVVLVVGGELLVRGASRLATSVGISPLVVGLTVVAFGTSSPELAVSLKASLAGQTDIAVGNVLGSNIFNVLFILGISALIAPLVVSSQLIRQDVPLMIAGSVLALLLSWDGTIGRIDGMLLFIGVVIYTIWTVYQSRKESAEVKQEFAQEFPPVTAKDEPPGSPIGTRLGWQLVLIAVGLVLLTLGARWLVDGATTLARTFGMSELLIGLTIVAAGTSLPEVAASIVATLRGERDIAVGNVVGSNIFNLMCVLGLSAVIAPGGVTVSPTALRLDFPVMTAVAFACLPIFFTGHRIARWEGALFLGYYVAYTAYLIAAATSPAVSRTLAAGLLGFVLPLTAITLLVAVVRGLRRA